MDILPIILGVVAGICIGSGLIYLFIGLRRQDGERLHLTFALFALAYAGAIVTSILGYKVISLEVYMIVSRWTALFIIMTLIMLLWFVATYTNVQPRLFLIALAGVLSLVGLVAILRANFIHTDILGLVFVTLPWGETIALLNATESIWEIIFFLSEIILVAYLVYACARQFRSGERKAALYLGLGLAFLLFALIFDIVFIDSGTLNFIYLGDYGFLPLLIVMSVQLANQIIKTEDELALYRQNLEKMVDERTLELEKTNVQLKEEIANRERVEKSLRQSERQARALINAPPDTSLLLKPDGTILEINEIGAQRLGTSVEEAVGIYVFDLFDEELAQLRREMVASALVSKEMLYWEDERDGKYYANNLYPILDDEGNVVNFAIFAVDITEQRRLQEKEKEAAAAEERSRLARDLHDAVTQTIYSATLIAEALPIVWERNPEEGQRNLVKLRQLVRGALAEMRTMLFELRPSALEAASLSTLLGHQGDALSGRTRIPVDLRVQEDDIFPQEVKIAFYRIAQEAFNNIAKHSEATKVLVSLHTEPGQVMLTIRDNGRGFDRHKMPDDKLGLRIMGERAYELGARLEVESAIGEGTQISVMWPDTALVTE